MASIELTREEQEEQFEWYKKLVRNFALKPIDLSASKEEVFAELISRIFEKKLEPVDRVYKTIERSYLEYKPDVLKEYLSLEDLRIKNPIQLVGRFFSDYIKDGETSFKNIGDFNDALAKVYVEKIEEIFGNAVFIPSSNINAKSENSFKSKYLKYLSAKGYVATDGFQNFFMRLGAEIKTVEKHGVGQRILLESYDNIIKIYIDHYSSFAKKDKETFDKFWEMVKFNLDRIESKLTDESKQNEKFVKNREKAKHHFEVVLRQSVTKNSKFSEHFKEFEKTKISVENIVQGKASEEDRKQVNEFYGMIERVGQLLSVVDEDGVNYPVNYYVATKFEPSEFVEILTYLQKRPIWNEEQRVKIATVKTKIRQNFSVPTCAPLGKGVKINEVLDHRFKGTTTKIKNSVVDLSDEAAYAKFVDDVEKVIKEYKLPCSELCITLVGQEFCRKRPPVCLKGVEKTLA